MYLSDHEKVKMIKNRHFNGKKSIFETIILNNDINYDSFEMCTLDYVRKHGFLSNRFFFYRTVIFFNGQKIQKFKFQRSKISKKFFIRFYFRYDIETISIICTDFM